MSNPGSGLLAATKYLKDQSGQFPQVSREYQVVTLNYTSVVTRDVDVTFCKVLGKQEDLFDIFMTMVVIIIPLLLGPVLTAFLELFGIIKDHAMDSPKIEPSNRGRQRCLMYVLASLSVGSYLANLYLVEAFMQIEVFHLLLLKYVLGYADLVFVPLVIIILDPNVRGGVGEVYRSKRVVREQAESSVF